MQKLSDICIRRPVFATMLILALVVVGSASYQKLGVDRFPTVDIPTLRIMTRLPGASPVEVETQISHRIEEAVNTVEGVQELRSISSPGMSLLIVTFNLNKNIDVAAQDVRERVAALVGNLPREADPPSVAKFDNDLAPIISFSLSGDRPLRELTELADKVIKPQLERAAGVGEVDVVGGLGRAINVWIDADRLAAYQIPITTVRDALVRQNSSIPAGNVTTALRDQPLRTLGRVMDPREFNDLTVSTVAGAPIKISDIGWTEDGAREQRSLARVNGQPAVFLDVRRQSGANTVAVIESVKQSYATLAAMLPPDVTVQTLRDQSRYIHEALHEIQLHLVLGSILASLVVLVFMRDWRSTVIAAVAIPASVISTFGMMKAMNFTLNSVTMLALVLMVGIVIDDAIVVVENIFRWVEEKKLSAMEAARGATAEIGLAVMATTLSLVVIFIPVSFMSSVSGRFLFQFGLTASVAVLVSLLVSFTLTPMMAARLLRPRTSGHDSRVGFYGWIEARYMAVLAWAMGRRRLVMVMAGLIVLSSWPLYKMVRLEYTPTNIDEGEFEVIALAREGTSLIAMNSTVQVLEKELRDVPAVKLMLASVGGGGPTGGLNFSRFYVQIEPIENRAFCLTKLYRSVMELKPWKAFMGNFTQRDVMQDIRQRFKKFPDLRVSVNNLQSLSLGGKRFEIDYALLGPDLDVLATYAEKLRLLCPSLGIIDADTTLKLDKPELRVVIDRARAANLGVDTEDIATALRIMVGGDDRVTRFRDPTANDDYYVQLRLAEQDRSDPTAIRQLYVSRASGGLVRLDNLVHIEQGQTASRIDRMDRQRQVSLRASIAPGYGLDDRLRALDTAVRDLNLPPGYTTKISGSGSELAATFREFLWAFLLSVIFMYMILASQFESFVHPITILLSLPLSIPFALISLWATGNTLNLYSALGILVLFGIVKKNAILQIDSMIKLSNQGLPLEEAVKVANRDRLRPILMTTLALVAGMIPLALGSGPGAEERRAIATVVIGGQSLSLLLTLIVTPVAFSLLAKRPVALKAS